MTKLDQFESIFRAAGRARFRPEPIAARRVLVVADRSEAAAAAWGRAASPFLAALPDADGRTLRCVPADASVDALLACVDDEQPDLIVTCREPHASDRRRPVTLGDRVEVLTQATTVPVLLMPAPGAAGAGAPAEVRIEAPRTVMAMTDHLAGDHRIVSWAAAFAPDGGRIVPAHVEDEAVFERYMHAIARTPEIDTELARRELRRLLLKEPEDFVDSCRQALHEAGRRLDVEPAVQFGRHVASYRALVRAKGAELLVLNTKDEDQLAMHGAAHPLAVELRSVPTLLL